ncbi:MAG TPA: GNAT family N-acetyltransferase [Thermomicrobiales bacterium]|nr:GNAT family N-acetyltransferase [Thermomicrobiales bacterium]
MAATPFRIEPLAGHDRRAFSCGQPAIDAWFHERAGQMARKVLAAVHLMIEQDTSAIVGFYTLSNYTAVATELPARVAKGMPERLALPAHLLGQLGVDRRYQGRGFGGVLVRDALKRAERMTGDAASLGVVVHALDERAAVWYRRLGFEPFPAHRLHLIVRMKDIRALP